MAISSVSSSPPSPPPTGASSSAVIGQQQFLQLLTAQLKAQDPLNPVSATDFTSQLAQMSTLSGIEQLNTTVQQMLQLQQLSQGAALMGKTVTYAQSGNSSSGKGVVQGVSVQNGQLQVQVGGQQVPVGQINGIVQGSN
jgi:flagellar basal-body rod modification protein FlgD